MAHDEPAGNPLTYGWQEDGSLVVHSDHGVPLIYRIYVAEFVIEDFRVRYLELGAHKFYDISEPLRLWLMVNYTGNPP